MTTIHICDQCKKPLPEFAIQITQLHNGNEAVFLTRGSWNGGDFCSTDCAITHLTRVKDPVTPA